MISSNYFCPGQMSIFDFLTERDNIEEAIVIESGIPMLLKKGQNVYKVIRGELLLYQFNGETWTLERDGEMVTYYQLVNAKGLYNSFAEHLLGVSYCTDVDDA